MTTPTLAELKQRHSVRRFTAEPIASDSVRSIKAEITYINTHNAGVAFTLMENDTAPFKGFARNYGMFSGVSNYIVAVVDSSFEHAEEKAGYFGEHLCLYAQRLGLSTCFVGGTYSAGHVPVPLRAGQKIRFLIAIGYARKQENTPLADMLMKIMHRHDPSPEHFFIPSQKWYLDKSLEAFPFLKDGLEGVACAPSSLNKRPARISVEENSDNLFIKAEVADYGQSAVDLGIAKYNFACAADGEWDWGNGSRFYPAEQ